MGSLGGLGRFVSLESVTDRPLIAGRYPGAWVVLLVALIPGVARYYLEESLGLFTWDVGGGTGAYMGVNYHVYHVAAEHALSGDPFYGITPEPAGSIYVYLYPPVTVTAFYPFTTFEWTTGYTLFTALNVLAALGGTALLVQYVEDEGTPLGWLDVGLVFSLFLLSIHVAATILFGNVNVLLGVAFVVGFWGLSRGRQVLAGVAFALAALFKVFPALVGLWLLRDRQWVATGSAVLTGVAGLVTGLLLFGRDTTVRYVTEVLAGRTDAEFFVGGYPADGPYYVTIQRPLSHVVWTVWPDAPYSLLPVLAAAGSGLVLVYFYRRIETQRERLFAIFATVVVALLVVPSFRLYAPLVFLPLVALLYTWTGGPGHRAFVLGGVLFSMVIRPDPLITGTEQYLPALTGLVSPLATFATVQFYAYAITILACVWHCHDLRSEATA